MTRAREIGGGGARVHSTSPSLGKMSIVGEDRGDGGGLQGGEGVQDGTIGKGTQKGAEKGGKKIKTSGAVPVKGTALKVNMPPRDGEA